MTNFVLVATMAFMFGWFPKSDRKTVNFDDLIRVLSKIEQLALVPQDPFFADTPHVCWLLRSSGFQPFKEIPYLLAQFEGKAEWYLIDDFPRICLFAQAKDNVELTGPAIGDFLTHVQADIPSLAEFLEKQLGLRAQPSKGIEERQLTFETGDVDDYLEPGAVTRFFLARDPLVLKERWVPTSEWDRALHYGLTMREIGAVRKDIDRLRSETSEHADQFNVLAAVIAPYSTAVLGVEEVSLLETECAALDKLTSTPETLTALKKLRRIVHAAQQHQLGMLIKSS